MGLPRARGDGPDLLRLIEEEKEASPRSRGWTRLAARGRRRRDGFPALAGMDRRDAVGQARWPRLPRARGDGPQARAAIQSGGRASPRSRGWTLRREPPRARRAGFPALAGMDPSSEIPRRPLDRLPRARGDGPRELLVRPIRLTASPRSRGWTLSRLRVRQSAVGFPALAGMDPARQISRSSSGGLPRARGDGPAGDVGAPLGPAASPRSRGWTPAARPARANLGGFPALAGMDLAPRPAGRPAPRLPRARGDGPRAPRTSAGRRMASPRSRGWTLLASWGLATGAGFPALAGMDPSWAADR